MRDDEESDVQILRCAQDDNQKGLFRTLLTNRLLKELCDDGIISVGVAEGASGVEDVAGRRRNRHRYIQLVAEFESQAEVFVHQPQWKAR